MDKRKKDRIIVAAMCGTMALFAVTVSGVETLLLKQNTYEELVKGELKTTSLSSDGKLFIAPEKKPLFSTEEEIIWDMKEGKNGTLFAATGHSGKIYMFDHKGKGELYCDLDELEVYALAVDKDGALFAGASPGGHIYKIVEKNKWMRFYSTGEEYIWDMAFDKDGNLLLTSGTKGKIIRVNKNGEGETRYQSDAKNVLSMARASKNRLICGTQGKGYVFELDDDNNAFILYEANHEEVRKVIVDAQGNVYAALNDKRAPSEDLFKKVAQTGGAMAAHLSSSLSGASPRTAGKKELPSAIIKITPEGFVQTLWELPESPIHTIFYEAEKDTVLVCAGEKGKLFRLKQNGDFIVLFSLDEKFLVDTLATSHTLLLSTGSSGNVYRLVGPAAEGEYLSEPLDARSTVRWGNISITRDMGDKGNISVATRSGNTSKPDATWSNWSKEKKTNKMLPVDSPPSRFIQYKLVLKDSSGQDAIPWVDFVETFYLPRNEPPRIKKITMMKVPKPGSTPSKSGAPPSSVSKLSGSKSSQTGKGGRGSAVAKEPDSNSKKLSFAWEVSDPNNDSLIADLYFKGEEESVWKEIEKDITQKKYTFDTSAIPDGFYRVKVNVSDRAANPPSTALERELVSERFGVDNTSPEIVSLEAKQKDTTSFVIEATVKDDVSIISSAKFNLDAKEWRPVFPVDEIFDSEEEKFKFTVEFEEGIEHTLSFQVTDLEGNSAFRKALLVVR